MLIIKFYNLIFILECFSVNYVNKLFAALGIAPKEVPNKLLNDLSINGIKDYIQSEHCKLIYKHFLEKFCVKYLRVILFCF